MSNHSPTQVQQKLLVSHFQEISGATHEESQAHLRKYNWDLEKATNAYLENPSMVCDARVSAVASRKRPAHNSEAANKLFATYAVDKNKMDLTGITQLCSSLEIDVLDPVILVFAFFCDAKKMGEFQKSEFEAGLRHLGVHDIDGFKKKLPEVRTNLKPLKKEIYRWVYNFAREENEKQLSIEDAVRLWELLMSEDMFPLRDTWVAYMANVNDQIEIKKLELTVKGVTQDLWNMVYEFAVRMEPDLKNYSSADAWPTVLDAFADHVKNSLA